jgi:hypothetical protein
LLSVSTDKGNRRTRTCASQAYGMQLVDFLLRAMMLMMSAIQQKLCTQTVEMLILKGRQELEVRPAAQLTSRSNTANDRRQQCCR